MSGLGLGGLPACVFAPVPEKPEVVAQRIEAKLDRILALLEKRKRGRKDRPSKDVCFPQLSEWKDIWYAYPKRAGSNSQMRAYKALMARLAQGNGEDLTAVLKGVKRYAAFCEATGKLNTEYVMTAARFFGPGREWENDWLPPEPKTEQPKTDEEWLALAAKKGVQAKQGESWPSFKARIMEA